MSNYNAPVEDMFFALTRIANIDNLSKISGNTDISSDNVKLLIEEAGKFAKENLDNINIPIIVRLQGTNSAKAKEIIDSSGLNVQSATAFDEAATKVQAAIN